MILAVDIGNSRTHFGLAREGRILADAAVPTADVGAFERLAPAFVAALRASPPRAAGVISVRPGADAALHDAVRRATGLAAVRLGVERPLPLANRADRPSEVGADRLANALAAHARARRACLVIDAGTAVTVDAVAADGAFLGGAIAAGVELQARALHAHTALLPEVRPAPPARAVGTNTVDAIRSGLYWGTIGAVRRILDETRREVAAPHAVFLTGGDADWLAPHLPEATVVPTLTLEGIARAMETEHVSAPP